MPNMTRVLVVASGGGHWAQLLRMAPAWTDCDVAYATTHKGYRKDIRQVDGAPPPRFYAVADANMSQKVRLLWQLLIMAGVVACERPHVVITTGASIGYFALRIGKLLGARTVWVDSIANAAELSLAGRRAGPYADLWLTQWPELAGEFGERDAARPGHRGSVI